jgi:hypothetical protein
MVARVRYRVRVDRGVPTGHRGEDVSRSWLGDAAAYGLDGCLDAVFEVELGEDAGDVVGDGIRAEREVERDLAVAVVLLSSLGQSGTLGSAWESIARWSPVGVVMTLFAAVLNLSAWDTNDSLALLACGGYIVVFAAIGIRWFQWDAR